MVLLQSSLRLRLAVSSTGLLKTVPPAESKTNDLVSLDAASAPGLLAENTHQLLPCLLNGLDLALVLENDARELGEGLGGLVFGELGAAEDAVAGWSDSLCFERLAVALGPFAVDEGLFILLGCEG